ncbi:LysR family regulatory protein [Pleurostoma richardsiae]|uniref:LysR family regulatory protein n=1 Tax=Pleurostoma richardsiae TaxID=41990 RepID=A0AA38R484_9PEZI|nr:LysR family regulatory protein [Pleurostoma richardsiae]
MFGKSAVPDTVPTDTIVPLHFFDDAAPWRNFILYSMFVFEDVLDPQKLRDSLEALATRDGWRKLGARLRRNNQGGLVYHIPTEFTKDRRPLTYSHITHDMNAADHPVASRLPRPSTRPAIVGDPDDYRPLFHCEGGPVKLDDYLNADIPQLGLHIVSFKDKTAVCMYWPHTMMDAMGKRALLDAWMLILNGRGDEVVVPQGADTDPLAEFGKHPTEPYKLADRHLSLLGLAGYGLSNIINFTKTQENRVVCVPASFVAKLQEQAAHDLAVDTGSEKPTFLSEGDVLCAWWTRIAVTHLPRDSKRNVVLNNAYSLRNPLSGDLFERPGTAGERIAYVSNAVGFIFVTMPVRDVFEKPLGHVAARIRRAITELGSREQVEAFAAMWRVAPGKLPPMFGERTMHMITYSNWLKAKLFELDFSAAVVTPGPTSGNRKPGQPSYIQNNQFGLILPDAFPIIGKDADGNFWLSGYMNPGVWAKMEADLAQA